MKNWLKHIRLGLWAALSLLSTSNLWAEGSSTPMGMPFFENYDASEYQGHNRNFDILCDSIGQTYVANFEGLLIYDGAEWRMVHTPGITRVTRLWEDKGHIWFSGPGVEGCVIATAGDSITTEYTVSDLGTTGVSRTTETATIDEVTRWHGMNVNQRLQISPDLIILATANDGLFAIDDKDSIIHHLNKDNGLCSNSITRIAYDHHGAIWGATDNGIFRVFTSPVYTQFNKSQGIEGQVTSILGGEGTLLVGTLQGMFRLKDEHFIPVSDIHHACWQLSTFSENQILAATADGLFLIDRNKPKIKLNDRHTLCAQRVDHLGYPYIITAELDGIYICHADGKVLRKLADIPEVLRMERDENGGIWVLSPNAVAYCEPGTSLFKTRSFEECPFSRLFEYTDSEKRRWASRDDGFGIVDTSRPELTPWLNPLNEYDVKAMFVHKEIAWMGGNFGLIRVDLNAVKGKKPAQPHLFIRSSRLTHRNLRLTVANDMAAPLGQTYYSYRIHKNDPWSLWDSDQRFDFLSMPYGHYQIMVRSFDAYGQIAESETMEIEIPYPFYLRWYAGLFYLLLIGLMIYAFIKYREVRLRREKMRLEQLVTERTNELRQTLHQLRDTQKELVRREKEATIGKLTSGLIDRILNPMNYINNFSHLSISLAKDLKADLEDEEERITPDVYEDCLDAVEMLQTNLTKIEEHGLSTTRILKAMEEMLKERTGTRKKTDLTHFFKEIEEAVQGYYDKDIEQLGITTEYNLPAEPLMANIIAEQLSKVILSMVGNSIYALHKKAKHGNSELALRISLSKDAEDHPVITLWDSGTGIEEANLTKIFDPFFTTKPTAEAPGVGLYLSQQIVQDMGGTITVRSVKNQYTEFTITL